MSRNPPKPWSDDEKTILVKLLAEGLVCKDLPQYFVNRTQSAIETKIETMGLERNRVGNVRRYTRPIFEDEPKVVCWPSSVKFENTTRTEAHQISSDAPKSGRFAKVNENFSLTGNAAAMCAL